MALMKALHQAVQDKRLAHALLFSGADSLSLKNVAMKLAQHLVCDRPTSFAACGQCGSCIRMQAQQSESLVVIEPENGVIKIDQVRPVRQDLSLNSWNGARVVLIDQAETLNPQAANALLKSIEEPPPQTYFFLLTTRASALLPTIRSRCQLVRIATVSDSSLTAEEWKDQEELVQQSTQWWRDIALGRKPTDDGWREVVREREGALTCVRLWTHILHQARRQAAHLPLTWPALQKVTDGLALNSAAIEYAWAQLLELKYEIEAQVDRGLAVESFWLKVKVAYGG